MTGGRILPAAAGLLAVAAIASACSDKASGQPRPPATDPPATAVTASTSTTPQPVPGRPADLDLTGLDPCKALTEAQGKQLDYDRGWERPPIPDIDHVTKAPNCAYGSREREFGSLIAFVTTESADKWVTEPSRDTGIRPAETTISGFPALQITVPESKPDHDNCQILVEVNDQQYIDVFSNQLVGGHVTGSAPYCAEARKVAAMVLANVRSR